MLNYKESEELRTKEELINYFVERGKNITEEEIQTLKNYYEKIEKNDNFLNLQQLDRVSGGVLGIIEPIKRFLGFKSSTMDVEMQPLGAGTQNPSNYPSFNKTIADNATGHNLKEHFIKENYPDLDKPESKPFITDKMKNVMYITGGLGLLTPWLIMFGCVISKSSSNDNAQA